MKLKNNIRLLITCDSGAGAGKTTVAKYISKKFKLNLLTSGLLYRYVAHRLIVLNKTTSDNSVLKRITKNSPVRSVHCGNNYRPVTTKTPPSKLKSKFSHELTTIEFGRSAFLAKLQS